MPNLCLLRGALARLGFCLLILLAALFAAIGPRAAQAEDACSVTLARAREMGRGVVAENPDAAFTEYHGDEARKLLVEINSAPPVSDWDADVIVVIDPSDGPLRVGLASEGCVRHAFAVPRDAWADLMRAALGDKS